MPWGFDGAGKAFVPHGSLWSTAGEACPEGGRPEGDGLAGEADRQTPQKCVARSSRARRAAMAEGPAKVDTIEWMRTIMSLERICGGR